MQIRDNPPLHLTYCLNVHPAETWDDNMRVIREKAAAVRDAVAPKGPFGLGLRLSNHAASALSDHTVLNAFKSFLAENGMYVFTINGFPYGTFHGQPVKERVYEPDWRTSERVDYTLLLADILAELLPEEVSGSISTVPCSYKPWITSSVQRRSATPWRESTSPDDITKITHNLMDCIYHLANIRDTFGKLISLGLEPEPGCVLETTDEVLSFFGTHVLTTGVDYLVSRKDCSLANARAMIMRHLGVCFDTCHAALQFEDICESLKRLHDEGICISKVQLSSALKVPLSGRRAEGLEAFFDKVYLHQTKIRHTDGETVFYPDLTEEVIEDTAAVRDGELRSHFHIPLYFAGLKTIQSTAGDLTPEFFGMIADIGISHLEIETYTFDVLPAEVRSTDVIQSIASEYAWVRQTLRHSALIRPNIGRVRTI